MAWEQWSTWERGWAIGMAVVLGLAGLLAVVSHQGTDTVSDGASAKSITTTRAVTPAGLPTALSLPEACHRFWEIAGNYRLNDEQSAAALKTLGRSTSHAGLAAALNQLSEGFQRHAPAISMAEVKTFCPP